jgi:hypothetical protein
MCRTVKLAVVSPRQIVMASVIGAVAVVSMHQQGRAAEPLSRIADDKDENFPKDVIRLAFDTDSAGNNLGVGQDVSKLFVGQGCTFATSIDGSFVGVQPYDVGGRSGGLCIATHKPLYQGIMTIRFCKTGDDKVPATVTTVGFWVSHVSPDGTALQAYDKDGKLIGSISTAKRKRDFLAVKSTTPIAYIKVVPNIEVDPDYAIDDLVFDTPVPIMK